MSKKKDKEKENKIIEITEAIKLLLEDPTIPRNVKKNLEEAQKKLLQPGDPTVRAGSAVYYITEISNDVNLPTNARIKIWNLLSLLETLK